MDLDVKGGAMSRSSKRTIGATVVLVLIVVGVAAVSAGCGSQAQAAETLKLTEADNGKSYTVKVDDLVQIVLPGNPTTGYSWTSDLSEADAAIMQQQGDPVYAQESTDPSLVGGGGTFTFTFKAADSGKATITLNYARSWEEGVAPEQTYSVTIDVE
jgi:inhibitor of cysteine peptidase